VEATKQEYNQDNAEQLNNKQAAKKDEDIPFEVIDKKQEDEKPSDFLIDFDEQEKDEEEVERFDLFDEDKPETKKPSPKQLNLDIQSAERVEGIRVKNKLEKPKMSYNNDNDIEELENEPAFKRKKVKLDNMEEVKNEDKEVSRFTLTDDEGTTRISDENSFLFDNVD
jgi:cell division protein FtsZ